MENSTVWWPVICGNRTLYDSFWSPAITLNTSQPDLTICFQRTALSWPPVLLLWLATPFFLWDLHKEKTVHGLCSFSRLNLAKTVISVGLITVSAVLVGWVPRPSTSTLGQYYVTPADYLATSMKCATLMLALLLARQEYRKGIISSGVLSIFWLLLTVCEVVSFRSHIITQGKPEVAADPAYFAVYKVYFVLLLLQFLLTFVADLSARPSVAINEREPLLNKTPTDAAIPNREMSACFWSKLLFQWITCDIIRGYKKPITYEQVPDIIPSDFSKVLIPKFLRNYFIGGEGQKSNPRPHRPLWKALFYCIGRDFILAMVLRTVSIPVTFINPVLLSALISFINEDGPHTWKGIVLAACMLVTNFAYSILLNQFLFRGYRAGAHARTIVNAAIYRKALRLSSAARKQTTSGQVVNLMSVDAQKVQDMYLYSTLLWDVPLLVLLSVIFLWMVIGPACLAGLGVLLVLLPLNAVYFAEKVYNLQGYQMEQKDHRFRVMTEILAGMKVVKLYAWEPPFQEKIKSYRDQELATIKYINYINAFGAVCSLVSPYLVSLAIFGTYVLISPDNVLDANKAFVTLSLINVFQYPMSMLPLGVAMTAQGIVSVKRMAAFLDLDELDERTMENDPTMIGNVISLENATFSWGRDERPTLKNISLDAPRGKLIAVVGRVGSGKSSLVSSILGEMFRLEGRVRTNGSIAYVPQQAWIQHATVRNNILFGKTYHRTRYEEVISACGLQPDLDMLPGQDQTEIGEKGINLSGGQKQRVSLARAVYQDEDIYVLDDPLSAVDAHVGKHIFEQVIGPRGLLKAKTRIFVTHGVSYLPDVDMIVVLKDGTIDEIGQYEELLDRNGTFADTLRTFLESEISDEELTAMSVAEELRETLSVLSDSSYGAPPKTGRYCSRRRRRKSLLSQKSVTEDLIQSVVKLVTEEKEEQGVIHMSVMKSYLRAAGYVMLNIIVWANLLFMASHVATNIWLSEWSNDVPVNVTYDQGLTNIRLGVYGGLGVAQLFFSMSVAFAAAHGCYVASDGFHRNLLDRVLHAPMAFFDTTPLGRIMNRFSKDLDVLDSNMPQNVRQWLFTTAPVITTVAIICYTTPIFIVVFIPLAIFYVVIQRMYVTAVRQWKRIDSVRRSPIYIHFDESVAGAASIRAYRRQRDFIQTCDRLIDESQRPWNLILTSYRWCAVTLEVIGACVVFFASLFAVLHRDVLSAGMAGLSVTYALQITVSISAALRVSSELETYVVSVERIEEYTNIAIEAPWQIPEEEPPADWPEAGALQFIGYAARYRPGLQLVLKNISCFVKPTKKVGIVGRTGAGKSSLSLALFRIIEAASGTIYIDGLDISTMGLHSLRRKISIIPQDPVVFSGTLRQNLDPFSRYKDKEIWAVLEHSHLKGFVVELADGLDYECGDGGEALSVGQRQLLCLARALLRKSKILVLDEATAAVDFETDALIQTTIREQFTECTILTVAHRLHTVLDYDKIIVLDGGRIREFDSPNRLISDRESIFYSMAKDAGLV